MAARWSRKDLSFADFVFQIGIVCLDFLKNSFHIAMQIHPLNNLFANRDSLGTVLYFDNLKLKSSISWTWW